MAAADLSVGLEDGSVDPAAAPSGRQAVLTVHRAALHPPLRGKDTSASSSPQLSLPLHSDGSY